MNMESTVMSPLSFLVLAICAFSRFFFKLAWLEAYLEGKLFKENRGGVSAGRLNHGLSAPPFSVLGRGQ